MGIAENVKAILAELPHGVELVAAAKTRGPAEILEAIDAGVGIIGENYVQEAADVFPDVGRRARWHRIGHLQTNKAKRAVERPEKAMPERSHHSRTISSSSAPNSG